MSVRPNKGTPLDRTYPGVMTFAPNTTVPFALDVNSLVEEISIQLSGSITLAGYATAPTVRAEGLENLIQLIRFVGNAKTSGNPTVNFSATDLNFLRLKTAIVQGTAPDRTNIGTANGEYDFETNATKFFGVKRIAGISDASFLDTRQLQTLNVLFSCLDVSGLIQPGTGTGGGTATLGAVTATLHSVEWVNGSIMTGAPYVSETQRSFDLTNISGINQRFRNVPLGNIILRQYFKGTVGDVNYADPSDAFFVTNLRSEGAHVQTQVNGIASKLDMTYSQMQSQDRTKFSLEDWPVGYAVYEYSRTRMVKDALILTGPNVTTCDNLLDITPVVGKVNTLQITDEQLIATN